MDTDRHGYDSEDGNTDLTSGNPHGATSATEVAVPLACVADREARHYIPPVPMPVFRRVCRLGSAGFVYLLVWRRARVERNPTVTVSTALLERCGFSRNVKWRALRKLEAVGLVRVTTRAGKNPLATVLDYPAAARAA